MIKLTVDEQEMLVEEDKNLLQACLQNGIYIPNLCYLEEMTNPPASCRLCFVEIDGESKPVPACKVRIREGMVVHTATDAVRRLQRGALRLLLTVHRVDCRICPANRNCELQRMARFLGNRLKPRRLEHIDRELTAEPDHPFFDYDPGHCVLCGKCVYVCRKSDRYGRLTFTKRGLDTVISSFGEEHPATVQCSQCRACVDICPVAAIFLKEEHSSRPPCGDKS
jgi:bidirectional [NiFe] hydrogenase diaphorase subunit